MRMRIPESDLKHGCVYLCIYLIQPRRRGRLNREMDWGSGGELKLEDVTLAEPVEGLFGVVRRVVTLGNVEVCKDLWHLENRRIIKIVVFQDIVVRKVLLSEYFISAMATAH